MADHGFKDGVVRVLTGLYETSLHFDYQRLPELFCGFGREHRFAKPVPYPVACSPQAWAAGTPLLLLTSALGLRPDAAAGILHVDQPTLPAWLPDVTLRGLRVGTGTVDLAFRQADGQTCCEVLATQGDVRVSTAASAALPAQKEP
jgi:glycogen debranching enzyme